MLPQDKYIEINDNKIRYWQVGLQGPAVLLVHGIAASVEYWMHNINELGKHFRVYAVDMPGFGRSDKPCNMQFSAENLASFLKDFLQHWQINNATLVGHSLGGIVCLQFAISHPELLEKLVLVDSAGFAQELPFSFRILTVPWLGKFLLKFNQKHLVARALRAYVVNKKALTDEFIDRMYEILQLPGAKRTMLIILRQNANLFGIKRKAITEILLNLAKINTPALIIWGRQDRLLPLQHAQTVLRRLPNATLHIFDHCGHIPQMEAADKFNRMLIAWLQK